jgi:hypothetical protein
MAKTLIFLTLILLSSSMVYSQKFLGEKMDIFKCISDVSALQTEIQSFLSRNITVEALIAEITTIEPMVEAVLADCGITNSTLTSLMSQKSERVPVSFDFLTCLSDLNTLVTLLGQLSVDVTSYDVINIVQDLVALRTDVVALLSDCTVNASTVGKGRVLAQTPVSGVLDCFSDITDKLIPDIENFLNVSTSGEIGDIIAILNVLLNDINTVLADCQLGRVERIDSLIARLNSISPLDCLTDVSALVDLAETIIQNFNNSQYEELISNLYTFVTQVEQAIEDCTGSNSTLTVVKNAIQKNSNEIICVVEVKDLAKELRAFLNVRTAEQMTTVLGQVRTMMPVCGVENPALLARILRISPIACLEDIAGLVSLVTQVITDAEGFDVTSLIADIENLVSSIETTINDCTGSNLTQVAKVSTDIFKCIGDVEALVDNVNVLLDAVKVGNFSQVLPIIEVIIDSINPLMADCGVNVSIENMGRKIKIDPEQCINDIGEVVSVVSQLAADITAQNWVQLIDDVANAIQTFSKLTADCLNFNITSNVNGGCLDDIVNIFNDVVGVVGRISNMTGSLDEIMQIIEQITTIVDEFESLENDCGFNLSIIKNNRDVVFLALADTQENTCWGSIMNLGKAVLDIVSGTDMMAKVEKIMQIKSMIDETKNICLGRTEIKKPDAVVSYVQAKGLRM